MMGYIYIILLVIMLSYNIIRNIFLFNKGQYNPYPFRKGDSELPFIVRFSINLGICVGAFVFITNIKFLSIITVVFLCYSFFLIVCVSILNYLSYKKIKDQKIIFHTVIFDMMVVIITTGIWRYVTNSL